MKKNKNNRIILLAFALVVGLTSCKKWLDVNVDKDNPNNKSVLLQNRLPWIQHFYMYSAGVTNFRTASQAGVYYSNNANTNSITTTWKPAAGLTTTPYQTFFVTVSSNLTDMYDSAKEKGAYHYMAAANVFHALGFMQMLDLYGEMPYTDATYGNPSPKYDKGKVIYNGCMAKLNEAISLFSKTQEVGAPALTPGDMMHKGSVDKWIKLCWGLKARYMLKLSKKSDLYNADSLFYFLSKGPQSNADNAILPGLNNSMVLDYLIGDPVVTNGNFNYAAYGNNQRISQFHYNLLTNMRGAAVVDPRMTKIVPAMMTNVRLTNGRVSSFDWTRSIGVDSYGPSTRLLKSTAASIALPVYATANTPITYPIANAADRAAFIADLIAKGKTYSVSGNNVTVTYRAGSMYISSTNYVLAGDTAYVNMRSNAIATSGNAAQLENDVNWYANAQAHSAGVVGSTGSFQTRPVSDFEVLTYHEMCFIQAEAEMRRGATGAAHLAYRRGVEAHINMMQAKLTEWQSTYGSSNPDMRPMNQADITSYLSSAAVVQSAGDLTMRDIMLQKYIAMGCSIENWNDMRRFNYSAGNIGGFGIVYPGYDRGPLFTGTAELPGGAKTDPRYWMRRWRLPATLELQYNTTNVLAINPHANQLYIWSLPVWWDCATDQEYEGYLQ
ncbi:MAG: SusD/RagB family nutrient-binding outer membrane lipoprotein [Pedobacter sp.]|uniref:SusD/RagB family nutrient-binding outer membrane lipoprotein n=1 Tax=Pedobacter sp. TaxID=1411316 RepID=UPI002808F833|nr:SusD/RagB family nutrient-binding outer membrane lipoprotein [Pedobacter sp.]MDQ8006117.1 SusD/RagB family nutrient-binding outer membrane lipoprotein [Pedobacter sp.]